MTASVLRWAIGSPDGPRSSAWRLWGNKKGDLYAAVRSLGGTIKASFHRDGKCQVGFTREYAPTAAARFGKRSRHWETWRLPAEPVARVLRIFVPHSDLHPWSTRNDGDLVWVPVPRDGDLAIAVVVLAPASEEFSTPSGAYFIGTARTPLRNAWAFCVHVRIGDEWARVIAAERAKLNLLPKPVGLLSGARAVVWDTRADHDRCVLELAYPAN